MDIAHGFTIDMYGPTSLRRNDLVLLRESNINHRIATLQIGEQDMQLKIFGDSIYPHLSHLYTYRKGQNLSEAQRTFNYKVKAVRIAIEWNYGATVKIWSYLRNIDKLKVLCQSRKAMKVYTVAIILKNCRLCLYGGQSSSYFKIIIDDRMLERYVNHNLKDAYYYTEDILQSHVRIILAIMIYNALNV